MDGGVQVAVVLGYRNDDRGELHQVSIDRCLAAVRLVHDHGHRLVFTGGHGRHFNTAPEAHAEYCRRYVLANTGISTRSVLGIVESANTVEDALLLRPLVAACPVQRLHVVTSDFHLARARYVFGKVFEETPLDFTALVSERTLAESHREHESRRLHDLLRDGIPGLAARP